MRRRDLEAAAETLASALQASDALLIGGMAVAAHGYVRATEDVDFVVRERLEAARGRLRAHGIACTLRRGDARDGDPACLTGGVGGVRFDVIEPLVPIDWQQGIALPPRGSRLRVVDLGGLLRLKLRAGGPRDLLDVAALLLLHPDREETARELALAYGVRDKLEIWLADPRLRRELSRSSRPRARRRAPSRGR